MIVAGRLRPIRAQLLKFQYYWVHQNLSLTAKSIKKRRGLFGVDVLTSPEGFAQLNKDVRQKASKIVQMIVQKKCDKTTVSTFDDLSNSICCAADLAECTRSLHSERKFAIAAENSIRDFTDLVENLNTSSDLYNALKESLVTESKYLTEVDRRTIHLFLDDFEQSGIHLPGDKKEEFVNLSNDIFDAGTAFTAGADKPVRLSHFDSKQYGVDRNLSHPWPMTLSRDTRRWTHCKYYQHNEDQEASLRRLIECRHKLARLTGFETYAHRAQHNTLLSTYENAHDFLAEIIKSVRPAAEQELEVLRDVLMQCDQEAGRVGEWDLPYLSTIYRRRAYGENLFVSRFFSLHNILHGFEEIVRRLYGVKFVFVKPEEGEIWPGHVIKIGVYDEHDVFLGDIYLDIDRRTSKVLGDCHFTVRCAKLLDNEKYQTPIVVLSLSLVGSDLQQPLRSVHLSSQQAENFFHEMGHAMHSMLGRTKYQHVAGTRCTTDMAEIPSNLMEYFFNDLNVLETIAKDDNGKGICIDEAASMITSRFAFSSLDIMQQAVYSLFDLELHGHNADGIVHGRYTTTDLFNSMWATALPSLERDHNVAWQHRFTHLVPYGAKYYSYLVARAAASLIWNSKFRDNPFSKEVGRKWAEVQSYGGSLPPSDLLAMILGNSPTCATLASAIRSEANYTCQFSTVNVVEFK
ncbi:hypothetical protein AB6A40_000936 [Gnathostoma spinigerum]|uniref:Peptidase M3A/M3B catalytic domain-containing protein n=1 Tax=Gnathostoma spinigerum TaxID=75299 RepID=A0ABD6ECJ8_9BILA